VAKSAIATITLTFFNFPPAPGWQVDHVTYDIEGVPPVAIDIKPRTINAKSHGKISVAILSSETFDATTIDQHALRFGATGQEQSLAQCKKNTRTMTACLIWSAPLKRQRQAFNRATRAAC
jgi:hypothetical protein